MDVANLAGQLNATTILPEGVVIITLLLVLIGDLISGRASARWTPLPGHCGAASCGGLAVFPMGSTPARGLFGQLQ